MSKDKTRRIMQKGGGEARFAYGMIAPMMLMFCCFGLFPVLYSLYLSFRSLKLNTAAAEHFVGFENYIRAFSDEVFLQSLPKTVYFVLLLIVGSIVLGMCFALLVNARCVHAKQMMILLGLLPWAIPRVVSGLMWDWIFDGNYGILNYGCKSLGLIDNYQWWFTFGPYTSLTLCAIVEIWRLSPFVALMFYAGLQNVPRTLYESAEIDGATGFRSFIHVTIPSLQPVLLTSSILITTWALKTFDTIRVLTSGGPGTDTTLTYLYVYQQAFSYQNISYASALGWLFALVIGVIIILYIRVLGRDNTQ